MKKILVPAFTLVAGLAAGWFGHQHWLPPAGPAPAGTSPAKPGTAAAASPGSTLIPAISGKEGTPEFKAAAKASLNACRNLLKKDPNEIRSMGKILAMLDGMKATEIFALAGQLNATTIDWSDSEAQSLNRLVFGKLAELDPTRALALAMGAKDEGSRATSATPVIEYLARTNPAAAEAAVQKLPEGHVRRAVISRLANTMAQTDGPGAIALMERLKVPTSFWNWNGVYRSWATNDPAGASAAVAALPRQAALRSINSVAEAWAQRDPSAAMAWAQSLTDPALRASALQSTITTLAQTDPAQATALASAQPASQRRNLLQGIATHLAGADGPAAITWANAITDPIERQRCLATVAGTTAGSDMATAREALAQIPPGATRNDALAQIVGHMAWTDPQAAKEWVLTLKPNEQAGLMGNIVGAIAETDPAGAEKLAVSLPPSQWNEYAWQSIAANKAMKDPAGTLAWAATLDNDQAKLAATTAVFETWANYSPTEASAALAGIKDPNMRRSATEKLAASWAARSPAEAQQWASGLTGEDRITALSAVWQASARDDPSAAAKSLGAIAAQGDSDTAVDKLSSSAASIAASWTGQDPASAAAWALTLPDGKLREEALGRVAGEWARYDPEAVSVWLNGLPHDRSRDNAIGQLVGQIAATDPGSAFTWASSMDGGEKQVESLKLAALAWKSQNPDAARLAVQNSALSDEIKARVMEAVR